jgi:protein-tyrosine-phosphatase
MSTQAPVFSIAFVCTGNRFRSPLAAAAFAVASGDVPVTVDSFGTLDLMGLPPLPEAVASASRFQVDLARHRSRPLAGETLAAVDLVIGFERAHVVAAVVDAAATRERTFTLPEAVTILKRIRTEDDPNSVSRAQAAVKAAGALRQQGPWDPPEIPDPLGASPRRQQAIGHRVNQLTEDLVRLLFGSARYPSHP